MLIAHLAKQGKKVLDETQMSRVGSKLLDQITDLVGTIDDIEHLQLRTRKKIHSLSVISNKKRLNNIKIRAKKLKRR